MEKALFKIIGNNFTIREADGTTTVTWFRGTAFGIILFFVWIIAIVMGIAGMMGMEEFNGSRVIQLSDTGYMIYWSVCAVFLVHLLINRKSVLIIRRDGIFYQRRPYSWVKRDIPASNIKGIHSKAKTNYAEDDFPGPSRTLYHFYIHTIDGKKYKIDSFGEDDSKKLKLKFKEIGYRMI